MAQLFGKKYIRAFISGFFVAMPVTVTFLDRVACIARVEGVSMQPSLNPDGRHESDVVLLNRWSIRNYEVQRGDIVSLVSPKNPEQKIIKRVIGLEGDIVKTRGHKNKYVMIPNGHIWVEGDHHGHSFDSNAFGPIGPFPLDLARGPHSVETMVQALDHLLDHLLLMLVWMAVCAIVILSVHQPDQEFHLFRAK